MKHPEPKMITECRELKPPRCCHTCDSYLPNGECRQFHLEPPEVFAMTDGICPNWELEIVF